LSIRESHEQLIVVYTNSDGLKLRGITESVKKKKVAYGKRL
jgi:hypothetical protein